MIFELGKYASIARSQIKVKQCHITATKTVCECKRDPARTQLGHCGMFFARFL
jgi:hypothetical protein